MARRKKKEAESIPEPVDVPVETPEVEPEVVAEPELEPEPPIVAPEPEREPEYYLCPKTSLCAGSRIKGPGERVYPRDIPGGIKTLETYVEKGLLEKR